MIKVEITQELIRHHFMYEDGWLYWQNSNIPRVKNGNKAGWQGPQKYHYCHFKGKTYFLHRLIFFHQKGYFPERIDHIDRNPSNCKIDNLRECTQAQNTWNMSKRKNKTSIYKGVCFNKQKKRFVAAIRNNGRIEHLGAFKDEESAALLYNKFAVKYFGEFANLNIIETTILV